MRIYKWSPEQSGTYLSEALTETRTCSASEETGGTTLSPIRKGSMVTILFTIMTESTFKSYYTH